MSVRVNLPPGCEGIDPLNGSRPYMARAGTAVTVSDEDAARLNRMPSNGTAGLLDARFRVLSLGTKAGRWCGACKRLWQAWSQVCPRCGAATEPE